MVLYKCEKCDKLFSDKQDYNRHKNRKYPCSKEQKTSNSILLQENHSNPTQIHQPDVNDQTIQKNFFCKFCKEVFSRIDSLKRHVNNYCKIKKNNDMNDDNKTQKIAELEIKLKEIAHKLEIRETNNVNSNNVTNNITNNTNNNITNNNITNNNITNNIVLEFKDDGNLIRFLNKMEKVHIMSKGGLAPNYVFKNIFYNPKRPQLHNAYASDRKLNKMMIYNGTKFIMANYKETLQTMIDNSISCVEQIYEEIEETTDDMDKYKYVKNLLDKLGSPCKREREATMHLIIDELKNEPYNCRELILQTHNKIQVITI